MNDKEFSSKKIHANNHSNRVNKNKKSAVDIFSNRYYNSNVVGDHLNFLPLKNNNYDLNDSQASTSTISTTTTNTTTTTSISSNNNNNNETSNIGVSDLINTYNILDKKNLKIKRPKSAFFQSNNQNNTCNNARSDNANNINNNNKLLVLSTQVNHTDSNSTASNSQTSGSDYSSISSNPYSKYKHVSRRQINENIFKSKDDSILRMSDFLKSLDMSQTNFYLAKTLNTNLVSSGASHTIDSSYIDLHKPFRTVKNFGSSMKTKTSKIYNYSKGNNNNNNDDNQDTEIVKSTLRESIDCLHFKFDENSIQSSNSSLSTFFRTTLNDLNKEFSKYDTDFSSANNWADLQTNEFLNTLNKQTRNRQENIFEFVKTEVNYLKILNITQTIYMNAMLDECKIEPKLLVQMFPDLSKLISLHKIFLEQLVSKYQQSSNKFIDSIGDILLETFTSKQELFIELYGKICCSHLSAKTMYKQLSINNKQFINFLQECRKYAMLRRYQIPDCLLIITQRPTKYLTLIESMISNSKEDKKDTDLLTLVLEKLKLVLRKVNDCVAFHQNSTEFKKLFDLIDPKSFTFAYYHSIQTNQSKSFKDSTLSKHNLDLQKKFTKTDLIIPNLSANIMTSNSINSTNSSSSNTSNSATNGISNSPSIKSSSSTSSLSSLSSSSSAYASEQRKIIAINQVYVKYMSNNSKIYKDVTCLTMNDMIVFLQFNEKGKLIFMNENSVIPCTIGILVRPKLDEILSIKSNNNINTNLPTNTTNHNLSLSNNNTNTLNNTNSTSNGLNNNSNNVTNNNNLQLQTIAGANTSSNGVTFLNSSSSNNYSYIVNTITNEIVELKFPDESSRNQWATLVHTHITPIIGGDNISSNNNNNNNTTKEETINVPTSSSTTSSNQTTPINDFPSTNLSAKQSNHQSNTFRCNSNVSTNSSIKSSGVGSLNQESILSNESNSSGKKSCKSIKETNDLQLSSDLASLLYSFNGILEQSIFSNNNGNLIMRSASSAGETVTKYNTDINAHLSIPKRAETFNGISKDTQIDSVNLNSDLVSKSRNFKNSIDLSDVKPYLINDSTNMTTNCKQSNGINSSSFSADSGLCNDLNQDIIDIGSNCSSLSLEHLSSDYASSSKNQNTRVNKTQLENILRFILNDYLRLKTENESLHKELDLKNKSIDLLKSTMDECKDQLDFEKLNLQKKFNELDLKKDVKKK